MPINKIPMEIHFSDDICIVLADVCTACLPQFNDLLQRYPNADGMRDISIALSCKQTQCEQLAKEVEEGNLSWIGIGWLIYSAFFVAAAQETGMSARQYADTLYSDCNKINEKAGYRAAWIEAYGEVGNSITWPQRISCSKKEALDYFRDWITSGRSHTENWRRLTDPDLLSFYTDAVSRSSSLKELPIYYSEGTLLAIHEAYRLGFPLVAYEGQCGTMNPIQAGIAFARGGAKMYDALWGCDFSPWTYEPLGELACVDKSGQWAGGMTADYMFRTWIAAYMSGCNTILHEVSYSFFYTEPREGLVLPTEYGFNAMRFYGLKEGALACRGKLVVPIAVMLEEAHGYRGDLLREYSPSGELTYSFCDSCAESRLDVWYGRTTVSTGDWQVHRLISYLWPLPCNRWGEAARGWPDEAAPAFDDDIKKNFKTGAADPREYDRFLSDSRFADCFDIINETASADVLQKYYKAVVLAGEIKTGEALWGRLEQFIVSGGTVLASAEQLHGKLLDWLGVVGVKHRIEIDAGLEAGVPTQASKESVEIYPCNPREGASVLIQDRLTGAPLAIEVGLGAGRLIVMLVSYGLRNGNAEMSAISKYLLQQIYVEHVGIERIGPLCQMLVNMTDDETIVTLLNHTSRTWSGSIRVDRKNKPAISLAYDKVSGQTLPDGDMVQDDKTVTAETHIRPFGVKIISFGHTPPSSEKRWPSVSSSMSREGKERLEQIIKSGPQAAF